jgi:hypothetical protein
MLSKCANPNCSNTFHYLHEGKLYLIGSHPGKERRNDLSRHTGGPRTEYAWLCSSCCRYMAIRFDQELGTVVVRMTEPLQNKKLGSP